MDMYKVKWTPLQFEIFRFFCIKSGKSFNLAGVASALKKSPTAVSNSLNDLKKEGLINVVKEGKMNLLLIEFNRNCRKAIDMKRVENLKMIYESELPHFLSESFPGTTIILFGSYSIGEDVWSDKIDEYTSDIDIAIIGAKSKEIDLTKFNKLLEREIILNFYPSFKEIHKHLKDNILNGILLSGSIDI